MFQLAASAGRGVAGHWITYPRRHEIEGLNVLAPHVACFPPFEEPFSLLHVLASESWVEMVYYGWKEARVEARSKQRHD